jgi:EmrB/QacA subfamily drug resistance transporter
MNAQQQTNLANMTGTADLAGIDPKIYARRKVILGVLCLSLVLVVAAVSSINTAIPSIRAQLNPTDSQLLWIVDIYAVVFAGLLLPAGALGDKFGRRGALQIGLAIFGIASVLSSQAGSPNALLIFRALMGLGAAFIMPSTLSLLTSVFPPKERSGAIAVWTGFAGAGGVIGTLIGGLVLNSFWWGSVFFVSVPIAVLALILVTVMCPSSKEDAVRKLDPIGAALSVLGFGALLYGIIEGPEKGWTSVHALGAFALAIIGLVGFVLWEKRVTEPMLDMKFFAIRRFAIGAVGVTFVFLAMFAMFFLIAQYLQSVRGYSPLRSGFATLPFAITMIAISPRGPAIGKRFGTKRVVIFGFIVLPIALLLLSFLSAGSPYWYVALCLVAMAVGPAFCIPTLSSDIVLSLPLDKAGVGSAVNDTTREVGGAIGIAVLGSILSSQYRNGMKPALAQLPAEAAPVVEAARRGVGMLSGLVQAAPGNPALSAQLPQLERLLAVAKDEFVGGMQVGFRVAALLLVFVAAAIARWYPKEELLMGGSPASPGGH